MSQTEKNGIYRKRWQLRHPDKYKENERRKSERNKQRLKTDSEYRAKKQKQSREYQKEYRKNNPEKEKQKRKRAYKKHKERLKNDPKFREEFLKKQRETNKKWAEKNPEKVKQYQKKSKENFRGSEKDIKWREEHSEERKQYNKEYRKKNLEKIKIQHKMYDILYADDHTFNQLVYRIVNEKAIKEYDSIRKKTPEARAKTRLRWHTKIRNKPGVLEELRERGKIDYAKTKYQVFMYYSNNDPKCACCGELEYDFLTIDHLESIVPKQKKLVGVFLYRSLIKSGFPPGYQVLCYGCNLMKSKHKVCPHQEKNEIIKSKAYYRNKRYQDKLKAEVFDYYSDGKNACECCGLKDMRFLSVDHKTGRNSFNHGMGFGGYVIHLWLRNNDFPPGFRILCINCNSFLGKKGNFICPHQREKGKQSERLVLAQVNILKK